MGEIVKSKKMLVEYSYEAGLDKGLMEGVRKNFIVPVFENGEAIFVTLPDLKRVTHGFVVFVGRKISVADLFEKLIHTGNKIIPSMDWQQNALDDYLAKVAKQKVGDVVGLDFDQAGLAQLEKQKIPRKPTSLP